MEKKAIYMAIEGKDVVVECRDSIMNKDYGKLQPYFTFGRLSLPTLNHVRMVAAIDLWMEGYSIGSFPSIKFCKRIWTNVFQAKFSRSMYSRVKTDLADYGIVRTFRGGATYQATHLIINKECVPGNAEKYITQRGERRRNWELFEFDI